MPYWQMCLLLAVIATAGCGHDSEPPVPPPSDPAVDSADSWQPPSAGGFAGSQACASCHEQVAETWRSHPMSQSVHAVDELNKPAYEKQARVDGNSRFYTVEYDEQGQMFHHEKMVDADGDLLFDQAFSMDFVVGSGQRAFAFLYQDGPLLFQSPLNWYSSDKGWDLSPGYVKDDPRRFRRRITDECLACHAGRVDFTERGVNRYNTAVFHEMSIGCENCHGPGQEHIRFHESNVGSKVGWERMDDPIVNPSKLSIQARESVCNQCHLQATARVLRPGRSHFDFRPGDDLETIWTVVDSGSDVGQDGKTQAVNHVQQMRMSRCYTESDGRLGCISCHDPHGLPNESDRISFYRSRCLNCHDEPDCSAAQTTRSQVQDSCIACHMPNRDSKNVAHVSQTDHRILRTTSPLSREADADTPEFELKFFDDANRRLEKWESDRAMAAAIWAHCDKKGLRVPDAFAQLMTPVLKKRPADHLALTLLATWARQNNDLASAQRYLESARSIPQAEESSVSGLLVMRYLRSQWLAALPLADQMIELNPGEARFHSLRADILRQLGRVDEAVVSARRALELDPTVVPVWEWLVSTLQQSGQQKAAEEAASTLDRMKTAIRGAETDTEVKQP